MEVAGLAHFGMFLANVGLFDQMTKDAPFDYTSNNASSKRDILGTAVLYFMGRIVESGRKRTIHLTSTHAENAFIRKTLTRSRHSSTGSIQLLRS